MQTLLPILIDWCDHIHEDDIPTLLPIIIVEFSSEHKHPFIFLQRGLILLPLVKVKLSPIVIVDFCFLSIYK